MATVPCLCPPDGSRHPDGDTVTLRQTLDFRSAVTMQKTVEMLDRGAAGAVVLATLSEAYLLYGVESWSLLDEKGKAIPANPDTIREHLLSNITAAMTVADEADGLYSKVVLVPLLRRASSSSPPTPTNGSTSRQTGSPPEPLRRSKRSSTSTTPTDDTGTTSSSPDGASSSSRSSKSAA